MKNKLIATTLALIFAVSITGMAAAAGITCTVETIETGKVILSCGDNADKLKEGAEVMVKTVVQRKAVEGC